MNLVEYYGGTPVIYTLIKSLYKKMLAVPSLKKYFANADIDKLIEHQVRFFLTLMGGPMSYDDSHLQQAHHSLGITAKDFDTMVDILIQTLQEANLEEEHVKEISMAIIRKRKFIVR